MCHFDIISFRCRICRMPMSGQPIAKLVPCSEVQKNKPCPMRQENDNNLPGHARYYLC